MFLRFLPPFQKNVEISAPFQIVPEQTDLRFAVVLTGGQDQETPGIPGDLSRCCKVQLIYIHIFTLNRVQEFTCKSKLSVSRDLVDPGDILRGHVIHRRGDQAFQGKAIRTEAVFLHILVGIGVDRICRDGAVPILRSNHQAILRQAVLRIILGKMGRKRRIHIFNGNMIKFLIVIEKLHDIDVCRIFSGVDMDGHILLQPFQHAPGHGSDLLILFQCHIMLHHPVRKHSRSHIDQDQSRNDADRHDPPLHPFAPVSAKAAPKLLQPKQSQQDEGCRNRQEIHY